MNGWVRPSVCHTFLTMSPSSYHHEIFRSYYCQWQKWLPVFHMMMKRCRAWCWLGEVPYCFSRSSLKFQGHAAEKIIDFDPNWDFRTVTLVWIHWWVWNDAQSLKQHRRDALTFFKVVCQTSRSHGTKKIAYFDLNWAFPDCNSSLNSPMAFKWCTKLDVV